MLCADRVSSPPAKSWGSGLAVSGLFTSEQAHTGAGLQGRRWYTAQRRQRWFVGFQCQGSGRQQVHSRVMDQQVVKVESDREGACKSMNHAQKYLAQANRHIAGLVVQIARQRVIVKAALDTGQRSGMAESLLESLEGSLSLFEKHRIFLLSCNGSSSAPPSDAVTGRSLSRRNGRGAS